MITDKKKLSWAFYDWANSAFATTVIAGFYPIFYKQYWSPVQSVTESTYQLGMANAVASLIIVLFAPLLGAIADRSSSKKRFLLFFTLMGSLMTCSLYLVEQGAWLVAIVLYILANIGFMGGNVFYDALLVDITPDHERDRVSALGYAFGYLGGGLLFALNVAMTLYPASFGFANSAEAVRFSFVCVALWWGLFSIPLFFYVPERKNSQNSTGRTLKLAVGQLIATFYQIRLLPDVWLFLLAYWFYIDGVDTMITQFIGFPAALLFGKMGDRFGAKTGIFIGLVVYMGVVIWAYAIQHAYEFYLLAVAIGLVQGGVQALSRSLYSRLIPPREAAQFFGFYNMCGKSAAVLGPLLMGWVGLWTGDSRYAILSVMVLFIIGAILLVRVNVARGQQAALTLEKSL